MNNAEAFQIFASQILSGSQGVFYSQKNLSGQSYWCSGIGNPKKSDFDAGPFPSFSLTDFLGKSHTILSFPDFYDSENPFTETPKEFPASCLNFLSQTNETESTFIQKIKKVQKAALNGEVWVLNLSHEISGKYSDESSFFRAFLLFLQSNPLHFGGVWWTDEVKFVSFSPELFLAQNGKILRTEPIKGTGAKKYLETSEKEVSELYMVTDLLRNDLGMIAEEVSVPHERVITDQGDFSHAHAEICAELSSAQLRYDQYQKLLPCGSISGAPKKRVLEYIQTLESYNRKYFTGTFGVRLSPEKSVFNILIRTFFLENGIWKFPVGAGITHMSNPLEEWKETWDKFENVKKWFK